MTDNESIANDDELALCNLLEQQQISNDTNNIQDSEAVLASFRQEWKRELASNSASRRGSGSDTSNLSPFKQVGHLNKDKDNLNSLKVNNTREVVQSQDARVLNKSESIDSDRSNEYEIKHGNLESNVEQKATEFFNKAVDLERSGSLYEAIQYYRKAMTLVPDIEFKVHRHNLNEQEGYRNLTDSSQNSQDNNGNNNPSDNIQNKEYTDLFCQIKSTQQLLYPCIPNFPQEEAHISCLPPEMLEKIFHWVVSDDLDLRSLDKSAAVCKGFFIAARSPKLWKKIAMKIWGSSINTYSPFTSWREMVLESPHPRLDGCYISNTTYFQSGESSFQDQNYQPWHIVKYYRYLRFFSDGDVLMMTTSDEPQQVVPNLREKEIKMPQCVLGHYILSDNKITIEFNRKSKMEKFRKKLKGRRFRGGTTDVMDTSFHIELIIDSVNRRSNWKLNWFDYIITSTYFDNKQSTSNLQVENTDNFPPFYFSRVKSYCSESIAPLC